MKKWIYGLAVLAFAILAGVALAAWPTGSIPTTHLDQDTDSPLMARPAIKQMADQVNGIRDNGDPLLKTGGTATGHISVPSGASGAQVPQAQAVILKSGGAASRMDSGAAIQFGDANKGVQNSGENLQAFSATAAAILSAKGDAYLASNAFYDAPSAAWGRRDTSTAASLIVATVNGPVIYTAPSGANPIAWSGPFPVFYGLKGSLTLDYLSIPAGGSAVLGGAFTGAVLGDGCLALSSFSSDDLAYTCQVSSNGWVRVRAHNYGISSLDPPSSTITVRLIR